MESWPSLSCFRKGFLVALLVVLVQTTESASGLGAPQARFTFENADISIVIEEVARRTGMTFLFDPARVKGKITVLAAGEVTPAQALELLRSALALHGYAIVNRPEGVWIVTEREAVMPGFVVRVVPLTYADAGEVASTLSWVAPPGVRVVPFFPTNSVVIAGHAAAVEQMIDAIGRR
jgi:type II secretory pathway component GspD/PulD (secretin)